MQTLTPDAASPFPLPHQPRSETAQTALSAASWSLAYGGVTGVHLSPSQAAANAIGATVALASVVVLAGPSLYVLMAHCGVPISQELASSTAARFVAIGGRMLAGLAPALALISLSVESAGTVVIVYMLGLGLSVMVALRSVRATALGGLSGSAGARLAIGLFSVFAWLVAMRIAWTIISLEVGS